MTVQDKYQKFYNRLSPKKKIEPVKFGSLLPTL